MWDKLEVTYEGTNKVKEARISSLVNEYELFKMAENENVEDMFSRFNKIICELKSLGMVYSNGLQVRKLIRSLPKAWQTKVAILEDGDLQKMTYDELRGNLMAYEQIHINRYNKDDKKKMVAFTAEQLWLL